MTGPEQQDGYISSHMYNSALYGLSSPLEQNQVGAKMGREMRNKIPTFSGLNVIAVLTYRHTYWERLLEKDPEPY